MSKKLTTEEFIVRAKKIHGGKYDYSKTNYINIMSPVTIVCATHGKFSQIPNNHLNGKNGCPKCSGSIKLTTEEFIKRAKEMHGNKYIYSKSIYKDTETKVIIICPIHGYFKQTPHSHIGDKQGCPSCARLKKITTKEFIKRSIKVHGNKYSYGKAVYVNSWTRVVIVCPTHGEFLQTPNCHTIQRQGCPKCAGKKKHTNESFIKKATKVHGNKYSYNKVSYININTKVIIICPKHGMFLQTPTNHFSGYGCPNCRKSKGEAKVAKILDDKKIEYVKQKRFENCINPKTKFTLPYDFYLPQHNMLIEYNGEQHYTSAYYYNKGGEERFKSQQYRDSIKQQYALNNNYKFLVIKYNDNIEQALKSII
jgi:hypothetical protein